MEIFKLFGSIFIDNDEANKSISKTDERAKGLSSTLANGVGKAVKWGAGIGVIPTDPKVITKAFKQAGKRKWFAELINAQKEANASGK